jgi:hypothetical protein
LLVKFAVVVPPSASTLFDKVGNVLTAAVLYTTPLAVREEPVIACPPEDAALLDTDVAETVVVTVGGASEIASLPIAK